MPPVETAHATTEGDKQEQITLGSFILQIGDGNGAWAHPAPAARGTNYTRRNGPVNLRPRPFLALLDRDEEVDTLKSALQASRHISLFGPPGIGKTSLLRSMAHLPETDVFPDGVVYLSASGWRLEDLLQSLFDAFYESRENFMPNDMEILVALQELKALIFLDDLRLDRDETMKLLAVAVNSMLVLSTVEPPLQEEGQAIGLAGLPVEDAFDLFVLELNRSLDTREQEAAREICRLVGGQPLLILQAASLVREKAATINDVRDRLQQEAPNDVILRIVMDSSTDFLQNIVAILAAAGGIPVHINHLEGLSHSAALKKDLQELVSLGLAQVHDSKFSLAGDLTTTASNVFDLIVWEDRLIDYFDGWVQKEPAKDLLDASLDLLLQTLRKAAQKNRWQEAIRLGRGMESSLILSRRWQSWQDSLYLILKAARTLGDRKVEAWALHQLGTRAACLGLSEQGREFLMQALKIRRSIRDRAGQAVTRHNLQVFFDMPLSESRGPLGWRRCLTCGTILAGAIGIVFILLAGMFLLLLGRPVRFFPFVVPPATATQTPTLLPSATVSPSPSAIPSVTGPPAETPTITTTAVPTILVDFIMEADTATWESSSLLDPGDDEFGDCDLAFSGLPLQPCGFARWENATLEDGSAPQNVLVVQPYHSNSARIWGTYDLTGTTIGAGDRLVTTVGFLNAAVTSGATFQVSFTTGEPGFSPLVIYETTDRKDGILVDAVTPLPEAVVGQSGYFILEVSATPNTDTNWASWVAAYLERP